MTDVEIRLKCLELAILSYRTDDPSIVIDHEGAHIFKECNQIYDWVTDWVTEKQKKDEEELAEKVRETEKALRSFNEV